MQPQPLPPDPTPADLEERRLRLRLARRQAEQPYRDQVLAALREIPPRVAVPIRALADRLWPAMRKSTRRELLHRLASTWPGYLIYESGPDGRLYAATVRLHPDLDERLANEHVRQRALSARVWATLRQAPPHA
jgi:hypothetical protein